MVAARASFEARMMMRRASVGWALRDDGRVMDRRLPSTEVQVGRRLWLAIFVVLIAGSACTGASRTESPGDERADGPAAVRDLSSIETLRDQFERDAGRTRLILLISPT
jgi:hypothetical protein